MSSGAYYLISLGAGLLVIAIGSALLVWRLRVREQRRFHAATLLDALARYTEWVAAQGRAVCFQAATQQNTPALQEIGALQERWFPELAPAARTLFELHLRLAALLRLHERLRGRDPEAWLESGHDTAFMALWREHCAVAQEMERHLAAVRAAGAMPHLQFPA